MRNRPRSLIQQQKETRRLEKQAAKRERKELRRLAKKEMKASNNNGQ
jgi:hypothetical protein